MWTENVTCEAWIGCYLPSSAITPFPNRHISGAPAVHSPIFPVVRSVRPATCVAYHLMGAADRGIAWHATSVDEVLARVGSGPEGIDEVEAAARSRAFGPNTWNGTSKRSRLSILGAQFANLPAILLLGSSAASLLMREVVDALAIQAVVLLNAGIGYRIEKDNEDIIASWRKLDAGGARVLRQELRVIPAADLVPGDVLVCQVGDVVPADARVIDAHRLSCEEAALTGESEPQRKDPAPVEEDAPLACRSSMLHAGTTVAAGRGRAVVVATGASTEVARVRALVEETRAPASPLERRMDDLGRKATIASVVAGGVAAAAGFARGVPAGQVLRAGVALGVAAIPEGLPVVVTASLVRAVRRMREEGMFVRRMSAVETLGGVTVVCADKTGTLTENDMRLEVLEPQGRHTVSAPTYVGVDPFADSRRLALAVAVLNSDLDVHTCNGVAQVTGSSTERAFVAATQAAGMDVEELRRRYPRRLLRERRNDVHYVTSLHDGPEAAFACLKGAPEQVLPLCARDLDGPLDAAARAQALWRNEELARDGLRVLALAWRRVPEGARDVPDDGFTLAALAGLRDPLRASSREAVRDAARAGIRTLILTGDQRATAAAIGRQVGLEGAAVDGAAILAKLDTASTNGHDPLASVSVISRVTPADKLRIVAALRTRGEIVAMAGDGVNDAPALKAADVGIAVGAATDVARQTADVVLAHEDLRAILSAVGEGRIVGDNLRRCVRYLTTTNLSEVALVLAGAIAGVEPLAPLHLLWVNILSDTIPALALALEPGDPGILDRPPSPPGAPLIARREWRPIATDGLGMAALGGLAFAVGGPGAAFAALPAAQLSYGWLCRAPGAPRRGRFAAMIGGASALHLSAILLPPLRSVLGVTTPWPLALAWFAAGFALPLAVRAIRGAFARPTAALPPRQAAPAIAAAMPARLDPPTPWKRLARPFADALLGRGEIVARGGTIAA
jgi:Ca2+-transporting ATPase